MPIRHNFGNTTVKPDAVPTVPEEMSQPLVGGQTRSAAAAGEQNGRPLVPAVRRPPPATVGAPASSVTALSNSDSGSSGPGFGTGTYNTLQPPGGSPTATASAIPAVSAAAPPGPPKRFQHQQVRTQP